MPAEVVPANVLQLKRWEARAKQADAEAAKAPALALSIQADIGGVRIIAGNAEDGLELYLSPEQAFSVGEDLWNAARAAKEAEALVAELADTDHVVLKGRSDV